MDCSQVMTYATRLWAMQNQRLELVQKSVAQFRHCELGFYDVADSVPASVVRRVLLALETIEAPIRKRPLAQAQPKLALSAIPSLAGSTANVRYAPIPPPQ